MAGHYLTSSCGALSLFRDTRIKMPKNRNNKLCENKFTGSLQNLCFLQMKILMYGCNYGISCLTIKIKQYTKTKVVMNTSRLRLDSDSVTVQLLVNVHSKCVVSCTVHTRVPGPEQKLILFCFIKRTTLSSSLNTDCCTYCRLKLICTFQCYYTFGLIGAVIAHFFCRS